MNKIKYAFVKKDMYDTEDCWVDVFNTEDEALVAMNQDVNNEIAMFVRDCGYAPFIREKEKQITIIHCDPEDIITLSEVEGDAPRTDYRVIEVTVHE